MLVFVCFSRANYTLYYSLCNDKMCIIMLCGSLDRRGVWGRIDTCICMTEFFCYSPETNTRLLIGYTAIQNKTTFNGICKRHSLKVLLLLITASSLLGCIPGKSQRHRSQHATGSQGHKESDTTSVQFSSVAHSCPTLCNPMGCSTPGLPVRHQLPEFTQTHVR